MTSRDDFTKRTIDILGKRVAFHCSNPECRKITIGPNEKGDKATIIGIAAHITAASPEGTRYNLDFNEEQRKCIDNGIWLCSNCATLIDKDFKKFPVELLKEWKSDAEAFIYRQLIEDKASQKIKPGLPFLEADIIWTHGDRSNRGYSPKTKSAIILGQDLPIIFWELNWNYTITIYNNSKFDAFNIKVEQVGDVHFEELSELNKINLLPALQNIDISAKFRERIEATHQEADKLIDKLIPKQADGLCLKISYQDESREHSLTTFATIVNGQFISKRNG